MSGRKKKTKTEKKKAKQRANRRKNLRKSQYNINEEIAILKEIEDIQDELGIIKLVLDEQYSVVSQDRKVDAQDRLERHVAHIKLVLDEQYSVLSQDRREDAQDLPEKQVSRLEFEHIGGKAVDDHVKENKKTIENMIKRADGVHLAVSMQEASIETIVDFPRGSPLDRPETEAGKYCRSQVLRERIKSCSQGRQGE